MSKTSSKVKDKYNKKAYDTIILRVTKGQKEVIREQAKSKGFITNGKGNINGYINYLIKEATKWNLASAHHL